MPAIFTPPGTVMRADVVPYVSTHDFALAPTGVEVATLVPGGDGTANAVELANVIRRASGWANRICRQVLAATLDVQTKSGVYVRTDGTIQVACDFWPVIQVDSFLAGPSPSTLAAITDPADISLIGRKVLSVPVSGVAGGGVGQIAFPGPVRPGGRAHCQWSYWNGWPHAALAGAVATSDSAITVSTFVPAAMAGRIMTIWDSSKTEQVTVAPSFTGGTVVAITGHPQFAHALPPFPDSIIVSALPDEVRQAVFSLISALIKVRGAEAYEMEPIGDSPRPSNSKEDGGSDVKMAIDLLSEFRRAA